MVIAVKVAAMAVRKPLRWKLTKWSLKHFENSELKKSEDDSFDCYCLGEEDDDDDEESYDLNAYYDWVKEHDHAFVAERVGLDLDAGKDEVVNYTITFSE